MARHADGGLSAEKHSPCVCVCAALTMRTTLNQWPVVTITLTSNLRHPALGS